MRQFTDIRAEIFDVGNSASKAIRPQPLVGPTYITRMEADIVNDIIRLTLREGFNETFL